MNNSNDSSKYVVVKKSGIHGKGIFVLTDILKGSKILDIEGDVINGDECERREEEDNNVYIFWNGDDCYIDTSTSGQIKYINHDCNFNCDVVENDNNGLMLIAFRNIKKGEELTIDYGYEDIYEDCGCDSCIQDEDTE